MPVRPSPSIEAINAFVTRHVPFAAAVIVCVGEDLPSERARSATVGLQNALPVQTCRLSPRTGASSSLSPSPQRPSPLCTTAGLFEIPPVSELLTSLSFRRISAGAMSSGALHAGTVVGLSSLLGLHNVPPQVCSSFSIHASVHPSGCEYGCSAPGRAETSSRSRAPFLARIPRGGIAGGRLFLSETPPRPSPQQLHSHQRCTRIFLPHLLANTCCLFGLFDKVHPAL